MKLSTLTGWTCRLVGALLLTTWLLAPLPTHGAVANWDEPSLDRWFHQGDSAPGLKDLMSTFANYEPGAGFTQARSGSFVLGFDTADQIPLVAPHLYQINSIRITLDYVDENRNVAYDPTADNLADILGGTDDPGKPIELFGVGYGNDYTKLGFGANDSQPPEFEESSPLWPNGVPTLERTFNVYPLGDDGTGQFGNVFNSPGGEGTFVYNSTEEQYELVEVTKPAWDTTPWAVATIDGLTPGQNIPALAVLEFQVNLEMASVTEYFQQSLSTGQLAVFIASLHDLTGFHEGGNAEFPAFHAKDSLWVDFGLASAPTLQIDYTILSESSPGDFDNDSDVDGDDLALWKAAYGSSMDGRDFLTWQRNYTGPAAVANVSSVPEPTSLMVVIFGIITGLTCRTHSRRVH